MTRLLIPGRMDRHGIAHPLPQCAGNCNQGRAACNCKLSNTAPLRPVSCVLVRPAITVHRISRRRRACRFVRAMWTFLLSPRFHA